MQSAVNNTDTLFAHENWMNDRGLAFGESPRSFDAINFYSIVVGSKSLIVIPSLDQLSEESFKKTLLRLSAALGVNSICAIDPGNMLWTKTRELSNSLPELKFVVALGVTQEVLEALKIYFLDHSRDEKISIIQGPSISELNKYPEQKAKLWANVKPFLN